MVRFWLALTLILPAACVAPSAQELTTPGFLSATRWDNRPEASAWTEATIAALKAEGAVLVATVRSLKILTSTAPGKVVLSCGNSALIRSAT